MCNSCISLVLSVMGDLLSHQFGSVPLGIAAQEGHTETVQRLLWAGANINHQNKVCVFGCLHLQYTNTHQSFFSLLRVFPLSLGNDDSSGVCSKSAGIIIS